MRDSVGYYEAEAFNFKTGENEWVGTGTRREIQKRGFILAGFLGYGSPDLLPGGWRSRGLKSTAPR